jgi:hypothetical protein
MIKIDLHSQYGIMLSGGLDSAVLLGLLLMGSPQAIIQPFTLPKHDGAANYIDGILQWMNKRFNVNLPPTIHVGDPNAHHRLQSTTAVKEIFEKHSYIDFIFNALNTNPSELADDKSAPRRDRRSTHPQIILPFADMTKEKILRLMYFHGLEELAELTHTCTEQKVGRCNVCWQCRERAWAFNKIGMTDTGTK